MKTAVVWGLFMLVWQSTMAQTSTTLVASGAIWSYSDKGSTPPSQTVGPITYTWKDLGYDDSSPTSWSTGASELGYGDGDESTVVSFGPNSTNKFITTYFRKTVNDFAVLTRFRYKIRYERDDGIIIYVNGVEVRRDGMPSGTITNSTSSTLNVEDPPNTFYEFYLPNGTLKSGNNVIAAEIHQIGLTSSDISFDLELIAETNTNTLAATALPITSTTTSNWKYADNGLDRGSTWRALGFDDSYWQQTNIGAVSRGRMGYGESDDPNTSTFDPASSNPFNANPYTNYVSFGTSPTNKFLTTYFRKKVNIPSVAANPGYELRFMRDDGIVIFINGTELPRDINGNNNNMPSGPASFTTPAASSIDAANEKVWSAWQPVSTTLLQNGDNIIAVEVHQIGLTSSDITFNLEMRVQGAAVVTRGPYLQLGTQTAATIRWRTDVATIGRVTYGLSTTSLTGVTSETASSTEHEIRLTGLTPDTQYFYSVGTTTLVLQYGPDNYFLTAPPGTTKRKIRIATFGDCGNNIVDNNQTKVRDGFLSFRGSTPTDLLMLTGDNSYDGDDIQYQTNFFDPYQATTLLKNSMIYAITGNHDYNNNTTLAANHNIPYFSIFNLPANAEAGGVASGTEEWYSFDYGPIHFVMLDGYGTRNVNGMDIRFYSDTINHPQSIWLKQDLAATTKKWKIVYLHFPPYSQGSHNSETESDLIAVRQRINPILERFGVDLVMLGHSHVYERSYPIHDQTGPMSDFTNNPSAYRYPEDNSSGRYDGSANSCLYKNTSEKKKQGTVYVVSGSAGALEHNGSLGNHPVMVSTQKLIGGSFFMEVEDNRLDAKFLENKSPSSYTITDQFTIMKDVDLTQSLTITNGQSTTLSASFISDYQWSNPNSVSFTASTRSVVVTPTTSATYVVRDSKSCVQDVFKIQVNGSGSMFTIKTGNWNDPTVWSANRVPVITDVLQVKHIVLIPASFVGYALRIGLDPGIKLQYGANAQLRLATP
jgi:Icc-related predicted phosphoesterase